MKINGWQLATVVASKKISPNFKSLTLRLKKITTPLPGQYYDLKIVKTGAYRSYSIVSFNKKNSTVEFGIKLLKKGEVSPHLFNLKAGESIALRGPSGYHFILPKTKQRPLLLLAGGSGIAPFISMLSAKLPKTFLMFSSKDNKHLYFKNRIYGFSKKQKTFKALYFLTGQGKKRTGETGRIKKNDILKVLRLFNKDPLCYISGSESFVNGMQSYLLDLGVNIRDIKIEIFTP